VIERGAAKIGYVRLWSGVGNAPAEARAAIRELNAKGVDGFVLDLREGWGGVPPEFVSVFDRAVPELVTRTRDEELHFDGQIRTPAIVLINERVRSGKEVLAYAIQKHRLATLLGTRTAGALLPGTVYCLDGGALLYLPVGTFTMDGEEREGRGIEPDIDVPFDVRYAAGRDVQLGAALDQLSQG
jgi:carboxyl-terminal processing protease